MSTKSPVLVVLAVLTLALVAAPAAPAAAAAVPEAETPTVDRVPPKALPKYHREPVYPPAALAGRYDGTVTIETMVLVDGRVGETKVLDCSRPKLGFEEAALAAVKKWRFEPAKEAGRPVSATVAFRVNFNLRGGRPSVSSAPVVHGSGADDGSAASPPASTSSGGSRSDGPR